MSLNPWSLIPAIKNFKISTFVFSLDSVVKHADPQNILSDGHYLRVLLDQTIMPAAMAILLFALCCALIHEQRKAVSGQSDFAGIFYRVIFSVAILSAYPHFFSWILDAAQMLSNLFLQDSELTTLIEDMYNSFQNWNLGKLQLAKAILVGIIAYITYLAAFIVYFLFFLARFMILSLLFILGPLVLAFNVWEVTARFKSWLIITIQAALWIVILKFIVAVSLSLALDEIYGTGEANLIFVIAANILYVYLLIHTPAITSTIVGGASFGFLHSQIIEKTTEKTLQSAGWMQHNLPRAAGVAMGHLQSQTADNSPIDPSTGVKMKRDPYGALSRLKDTFGIGDKK